jgi:hypothetical protein
MVPICCIYIIIQDLAELFFRQSTNYMVYSIYYTRCYKVITFEWKRMQHVKRRNRLVYSVEYRIRFFSVYIKYNY